MIKEINLETGQSEKEHFLEVANFEKTETQNDLAFVLGIRENAGANATKSFFTRNLE